MHDVEKRASPGGRGRALFSSIQSLVKCTHWYTFSSSPGSPTSLTFGHVSQKHYSVFGNAQPQSGLWKRLGGWCKIETRRTSLLQLLIEALQFFGWDGVRRLRHQSTSLPLTRVVPTRCTHGPGEIQYIVIQMAESPLTMFLALLQLGPCSCNALIAYI